MKETHYQKFGLNENASFKDIKKAYRKLVLKYHPDKNSGEAKYDAIIKDINNIYEILSNPYKRKEYDDLLKQQSYATNYSTASTTYAPAEEETDFITSMTNFFTQRPLLIICLVGMLLRMATCNNSNHYVSQSDSGFVNDNSPSVGETFWGSKSNPDNSSQQNNH